MLELVDEADSKSSTFFSASYSKPLDFTAFFRYHCTWLFRWASKVDLQILCSTIVLSSGSHLAGVLELVDEADSKSVGLITRVGSSPTTGTIFEAF